MVPWWCVLISFFLGALLPIIVAVVYIACQAEFPSGELIKPWYKIEHRHPKSGEWIWTLDMQGKQTRYARKMQAQVALKEIYARDMELDYRLIRVQEENLG